MTTTDTRPSPSPLQQDYQRFLPVSYTHLRAHET